MKQPVAPTVVDLTLSDKKLAEQFGVKVATIALVRKALRRRSRRVSKYDKADWTRSDQELAKQFGVTSIAIRFARVQYGSPRKRVHTYDGVDWTQANDIIAKKLGLSKRVIAYARWRHSEQSRTKWQNRALRSHRLGEYPLTRLTHPNKKLPDDCNHKL